MSKDIQHLWDPEYVVRTSRLIRDAIEENFRRIHELGEGLHPQQVMDMMAKSLDMSFHTAMMVMFAGDLIESDRELRDMDPLERECWYTDREEVLSDLQERVESGDGIAEIAASQFDYAEVDDLNALFYETNEWEE